MTQNTQVANSGEGTRPTTDGGVNNIGAGEKLTSERTAAGGEVSAPAPLERMGEKRSDVEATRHDDSAAFNLHDNPTPVTNTEPRDSSDKTPVNQPKS